MKISTKGRYGLRAMIDLAVHASGEEPITLKSIAERQNLSERYLEQIFSALKKNALVNSIKGPQGGYVISKGMHQISVGNILRALEGNLHIVTSEDMVNDKIEECIKNNVWNRINESIDKIVDCITLEDLVFEYNKSISEGYMYYI
ncbi:RrF2 family transcriptional regulator [Clostridium ganghwense]|uniref:Rrf2 family transcriptional regulator n=1 Tax=Clostridium ganghwense TaxID=312089 RepID=A0ABT4CN56_9CLOT|nr:Rrf2 family transcriptional regulator [Clostridium ganghwense]MCY6369868.1 Rrf2 family transcriptional regulator [Clostridium ganghwense]